MKPRVYYSFRSPYARLGVHILSEAGIDMELIPFTGPPEGTAFADPLSNKPKLAYYGLDVPRMTWRRGLEIARPDPFEVDFAPAHMAAIAADKAGKGLAFVTAVYEARWGRGENVSEPAVLAAAAKTAGLPADLAEAAAKDPAIEEEMRRHRALVEEDQAFGVPFAVFGKHKYWGHDRFELLVEDVRAA